jgi:hypothetical protein
MLFLRWYFFVAPNVLLGCCAFFFWRRHLQRQYPIFAAYIAFQLLEFAILFIADLLIVLISSLATYRWLLVVGTGVTAAIQIGVLYELAGELLLSRSSLTRSVGPLLRWSLATALLAGAGFSAILPRTGSERVVLAFQALDFASNLMGAGLLLALMLYTRALRISWRSLPAGIALGFGINASAEICGAALLSILSGGTDTLR